MKGWSTEVVDTAGLWIGHGREGSLDLARFSPPSEQRGLDSTWQEEVENKETVSRTWPYDGLNIRINKLFKYFEGCFESL